MSVIGMAQLEGFFQVAKAGSYSAAARQFPYPITQPGVHKQVRRLEDLVGVRLVVGSGRAGVKLTSEGRALFEFIAPFFEQLPSVVRSLREGPLAGELHIETSALVLRHLLPAWMRRVRARSPGLVPRLTEVEIVDVRRLWTGEVDLIVDYLPEVPAGLSALTVGEATPFVALPRSMVSSTGRGVPWRALRTAPWVGYPAHLPHAALQREALAHHEITTKPAATATSVESILALVAAGVGFSIVPWMTRAGPRLAGIAARRLPRAVSFPIRALYRESSPRHALVEAALSSVPAARKRGVRARSL